MNKPTKPKKPSVHDLKPSEYSAIQYELAYDSGGFLVFIDESESNEYDLVSSETIYKKIIDDVQVLAEKYGFINYKLYFPYSETIRIEGILLKSEEQYKEELNKYENRFRDYEEKLKKYNKEMEEYEKFKIEQKILKNKQELNELQKKLKK